MGAPKNLELATSQRNLDGSTRHLPDQVTRASSDIIEGLNRWELWGTLGWHDIRQRYRRSNLGPFWLTISMGVLVAALGLLYGGLLRQPLQEYLPYIATGLIVWNLILNLIMDGCSSFIAAEGLIKQQSFPFSVHVFRMIWRNLIIFGHNMIIYVIVCIMFGLRPGLGALCSSVIGVILICINGAWWGILLGLLNLRFRDILQIVASVMQVMFFITPIIWRVDQLSGGKLLAVWLNPFYYLMEIVRAPLLGQMPPLSTWLIAATLTLLGCAITFFFYVRFRRRIPYWI